MKATVDLIVANGPPKRVSVTVPKRKSPTAQLNAVDKAILKEYGDDASWGRWNLVELEEE